MTKLSPRAPRTRPLLAAALVALTVAPRAVGASAPPGDGAALPAAELTLVALSSYRPGLEPAIEQFEAEHPGVTIEASYYEAGDAYTTTVPTQFAGGNGSDIVYVLGGQASPYSATAFARAGYLLDLSDMPWVDTMYEPTRVLFEHDGRLVARDFGVSTLSVYSYNRDFFSDHDLAPPTTFDELVTLCGTIAELGTVPIAWGGGNAAVNINNSTAMAGSTVLAEDPEWLERAVAGDVTFTDTAGWRTVFEHLEAMNEAECFAPGMSGQPLAEMVSSFASGEAATMFTSSILQGQVLTQSPDLNIGVFPPPGDTAEQTRVTAYPAGGLGIWSETEYPQHAAVFLEFMSDEEVARQVAEANGIVSSGDATVGELGGLYADLAPFFEAGQVVTDMTTRWPNTQMGTLSGQSIQGLFTGQKSVDDVLADMDQFFAQP